MAGDPPRAGFFRADEPGALATALPIFAAGRGEVKRFRRRNRALTSAPPSGDKGRLQNRLSF